MISHVPVLITWDVDPYREVDPSQTRQSLQVVLDLCQELGIPGTFFLTAEEAPTYRDQIAEMTRTGHEIACHGLTHGDEEEYGHMPEDMQCSYIDRATSLLEELAHTPITAFRGPRVKVSAVTLRLLAERGYLTDSSVCSQRLDLVSSNWINFGWLTAPRLPYHPHHDSAFKQGDLNILEVPVSALVLPFISTTLYIFRLALTKILLRALYFEACRRAKPIVYLAHPKEFGPQIYKLVRWSDLSLTRLRVHGLKLRNNLKERDPEVRLRLTRELLSYIASMPGVQFMTMREYNQQFHKAPGDRI